MSEKNRKVIDVLKIRQNFTRSNIQIIQKNEAK